MINKLKELKFNALEILHKCEVSRGGDKHQRWARHLGTNIIRIY